MEVGDCFILGIAAPELTELEKLWVRQSNTVAGFGLDIKIQDHLFADVGGALSIDFTNECNDQNRWVVNPVQKLRYDNSASNTFSRENEVFWLVAEVTSLPDLDTYLAECDTMELPQFQVRAHYEDSCLSPEGHTRAPQDTYDAWTAATAASTDEFIIWEDIPFTKRGGGFDFVDA